MDTVKNGKIVVNRRQTVFENTRFQVFADHIADKRGNEVRDFLVVSPRNQIGGLSGILVVPVRKHEIFFLPAYRHPIGGQVLELPRGFIDRDEGPSEAALRELTEETGLICTPENLVPLGFFYPDPGV